MRARVQRLGTQGVVIGRTDSPTLAVPAHRCARRCWNATMRHMGKHDEPPPKPDLTGDAQPPPGRPLPPPPDPGKHSKPDPPDKDNEK